MVIHPIPPTCDALSKILILGSFPSVKSREQGYFYGHPQNRFWKVLAAVFEEDVPQSVDEKKTFLHRHRIAVWDVIASCDIVGSSDSKITNVRVNDVGKLLRHSSIERIYVNGKKAGQLYQKYLARKIGIEAAVLPSTSPANAAWKMEDLTKAWKVIIEEEDNNADREE